VDEQVHCSIPRYRRERRYDVQVKGDSRSSVKRSGDAADNHEINAVIVKLVQDIEEAACHNPLNGKWPGEAPSDPLRDR
jgi:hypothetical protein